jgi:hypothetical protein
MCTPTTAASALTIRITHRRRSRRRTRRRSASRDRDLQGFRRNSGRSEPQHDRRLRHGELLGHRHSPRRRTGDGSGVLADYPNVDGVVAFAHGTGAGWRRTAPASTTSSACSGVMRPTPTSARRFRRTGCEVMQLARMKAQFGTAGAERFHVDDPGHRWNGEDDRSDRRADPRAPAGSEPRRS